MHLSIIAQRLRSSIRAKTKRISLQTEKEIRRDALKVRAKVVDVRHVNVGRLKAQLSPPVGYSSRQPIFRPRKESFGRPTSAVACTI